MELKEGKKRGVSNVMKYYLKNIKTDVYLSRRILRELKTRVDVFLGVDFDCVVGGEGGIF